MVGMRRSRVRGVERGGELSSAGSAAGSVEAAGVCAASSVAPYRVVVALLLVVMLLMLMVVAVAGGATGRGGATATGPGACVGPVEVAVIYRCQTYARNSAVVVIPMQIRGRAAAAGEVVMVVGFRPPRIALKVLEALIEDLFREVGGDPFLSADLPSLMVNARG